MNWSNFLEVKGGISVGNPCIRIQLTYSRQLFKVRWLDLVCHYMRAEYGFILTYPLGTFQKVYKVLRLQRACKIMDDGLIVHYAQICLWYSNTTFMIGFLSSSSSY